VVQGKLGSNDLDEAYRTLYGTLLRERLAHVIPASVRPDLFPLRRKVVERLRQRDPEGAAGALDGLIAALRAPGEVRFQVEGHLTPF
jgi:hypothetical protein